MTRDKKDDDMAVSDKMRADMLAEKHETAEKLLAGISFLQCEIAEKCRNLRTTLQAMSSISSLPRSTWKAGQ